jgi:hypothetical protein
MFVVGESGSNRGYRLIAASAGLGSEILAQISPYMRDAGQRPSLSAP